ncbi:sigma-54-dependent transcriptional regulator [Clostridium chromiireducens]|uniref:Transcriptional regulatory protein ZraR n=1 Tax=Clostridium chromiireducens TaxID=225345 RepID=A0A1V4J0E0_9CLOT|nr:sigma-54-dependent transcriptional regulator [Clostridium chromiireducens]OPJ65619.1 transcriptional regulatory protein ZraR [Clostridium chromiireducens]
MRILFIAPYLGLKELAQSILDEYSDIHIDVYQGNYEQGPKLLKKLNADEKYDAIITRGGTVETCRKVTTTPIIEIYINAFDILRILKLSEGYDGKKIFLAYPSIVNSFKQLSELMGYYIESQCYFEHKNISSIIENLKEENYELIIGDNMVYETAQKLGINSILLTSGIESLRSAIDEAIRLCNALSRDKKQIIESNLYIEDQKINEDNIDKFVRIFNANEISPSFIDTVFPKTISSQISALSDTSLPTIITGEDGMCKSDVGYLCFCYGPQKRKSLVCISCFSVPENYNYDLLENTIIKHLWNEGGTLFLEDIDQLCIEGQKQIINILKKLTKNCNVKIIASSELPVEICVSSGKLLRQLRSILDEVRIELMPLKYYTNEINNMISMYLAKLDVRCASQVVGINKGGINLLSDYDWPENIRQFMRVINQLALTCNGSYIAQTGVKVALKKEHDNHKYAILVPIDLSGSLKEIETRIIKHIMAEEGMNQVKVEKRLEIGHSTLWRKLK